MTTIICPTCKEVLFTSKRVTLRPAEESEIRLMHKNSSHPEADQ